MKIFKNPQKILFISILIFLGYLGGGQKYIDQAYKIVMRELLIFVENENGVKIDEQKEGGQQLNGRITRVSDGDTVVLTDTKSKRHKIRLDGIDAPEIGQPFGYEAKDFVEKLVLNKDVKVKIIGVDQYNRILGIVYTGGININEELLSNGLAWQYHFNKNSEYEKLVQQAKKNRINIWSDNNSLDPYTWRKRNNK